MGVRKTNCTIQWIVLSALWTTSHLGLAKSICYRSWKYSETLDVCEKLVVSELSISLSDVWEGIIHFLLTLYLSCSIIIIIVLVIKQILLITHMITDRIGLHSVLLSLLIIIIILLLLIYHPLLLSGGGVLAHTILGVDFNDQTGDIRWAATCPWDWVTIKRCQKSHQKNQLNPKKACKNSCFSSLHAYRDTAPGGTSVP